MTTNEEIALLPKWAQEIYGRKWGNTIPKMLESWASALAENAILRRIAEAAQVDIQKIVDWAEAYPLQVFQELDKQEWEEVARVLKEQGAPSLARISASNMRHVIEGVRKHAQDALSALDGEK